MAEPWLTLALWAPHSLEELSRTLDGALGFPGALEVLVVDPSPELEPALVAYGRRVPLRRIESRAPGSVAAWATGLGAAAGRWVLPLRGGDALRPAPP